MNADSAPATVAAVGDLLEEADEVIRNSLIDCGGAGFGHWKGEIPLTRTNPDRPAKTYADRLLGGPAQEGDQVEIGCGRVGFGHEKEAIQPTSTHDGSPGQGACDRP